MEAQAGRLSKVTYCYCLCASCFSMAWDLTVWGAVESTRRKDGLCHQRDARGLWADGWTVCGSHKTIFTSTSGNKQPCSWQSFCKPVGKQACLALGSVVKALNWRAQPHFLTLSSPVECPCQSISGVHLLWTCNLWISQVLEGFLRDVLVEQQHRVTTLNSTSSARSSSFRTADCEALRKTVLLSQEFWARSHFVPLLEEDTISGWIKSFMHLGCTGSPRCWMAHNATCAPHILQKRYLSPQRWREEHSEIKQEKKTTSCFI